MVVQIFQTIKTVVFLPTGQSTALDILLYFVSLYCKFSVLHLQYFCYIYNTNKKINIYMNYIISLHCQECILSSYVFSSSFVSAFLLSVFIYFQFSVSSVFCISQLLCLSVLKYLCIPKKEKLLWFTKKTFPGLFLSHSS